MVAIPRAKLPDPADRCIAATGVSMGLAVVTSDERLRRAGDEGLLHVIW
jgi:PIN domain nuclease of toxin-antitoxin system